MAHLVGNLEVSTPPTDEPVTLEEARTHLSEDDAEHDAMIRELIQRAREYVEVMTKRQIMPATYTLKVDQFPYHHESITLPRAPLSSVTSVAYVDINGAAQTWAASNYIVSTPDEKPGTIRLAFDKLYPQTRNQPEAVTITFVCGYADQDSVPQRLKGAVLMLVTHWFLNREPNAPLTQEIRHAVMDLTRASAVPRAF